MPTYSRRELVADSLRRIGVIGAGESPGAADYKTGNSKAQQVLETFYDRGLIPFNVDGPVAPKFYLPLVDLIAYELIPDYGEMDQNGRHAANAQRATALLWQYREGPVNQNPTEIDAY